MIELTNDQNVAIVGLNRGITNALDLELMQQLSRTMAQVVSDPKVNALILTSTNEKFFSIGFDIPHLYDLPRQDFKLFYKTFNRTCLELLTFPKPTIAAIPGHAIAGGCILTLCCDQRLIQMGRKLMGLNEIKLGVPVPYLAHCVLRDLVGARAAREVVETGGFYDTEETLHMGLVDRVCSDADLLPCAVEEAGTLGEMDPGCVSNHKGEPRGGG